MESRRPKERGAYKKYLRDLNSPIPKQQLENEEVSRDFLLSNNSAFRIKITQCRDLLLQQQILLNK